MAVDPKDDHDDDEESAGPTRRIPKHLGVRKSPATVESALDDFIIQAKQKTLDVKEFTPETREQQLRDQIADLEKKLAAAEARAVDEPTAGPPRSRPWGAMVAAFVVGAAAMFAVTFVLAPHDTTERAPVAAPSDPSPTPVQAQAPTPPPTPTPAPPPAPVPAAAPTPTPDPEPGVEEPTPAPERPKAAASKAKQTKPRPAQPSEDAKPKPTPTPAPPAETGSNGGDLYNPF